MPTKNKKQQHQSKRTKAIVLSILVLGVVVCCTTLFLLHRQKLANNEAVTLYLPDNITYDAVVDSLDAHGCIGNHAAFSTLARLRNYKDHVKGGCYKLTPGMSVWRALTKLYYGNQDPIHLTINKHRTKQSLSGYLGRKLEIDSSDMMALFNNDSICRSYGHTTKTIIGMFMQNTYDVYWNISATNLMDRMQQESDRFWTDKRLRQCKALNLTPDEVVTLASIVEEESNKNDEKPDIASVYLNRIRKGMLLQADPTLKYAVGDFTLRRLLNKHMEVDNPYNTYKYRGLPPGPICIPGQASIDAVLKNKKTDYLYFCAKSDFSGYHAFAKDLAQHNANAEAFHRELNRRKIFK